jgi:hypothetical protein
MDKKDEDAIFDMLKSEFDGLHENQMRSLMTTLRIQEMGLARFIESVRSTSHRRCRPNGRHWRRISYRARARSLASMARYERYSFCATEDK